MVAVTLAGCDQVPNEPTTDSTAFYKPGGGGGGGGGGGASTFDVVFSADDPGWDIKTKSDPDEYLGRSGVGKNSSQIEIGGVGRLNTFQMSAAFLDGIAGWEDCFRVYGDGTEWGGFSGDMKPDKQGGGVTTTFYFNRVAKDGTTAVGYQLTLNGDANGDFPPKVSETTRITFTQAEISGGKGKKGNSAGSACSGEPSRSDGSGVSVTGKS